MQDPMTVFLLMRTRLLMGTIKRLDPSCIRTTAPLLIKLTSSEVLTSLPTSDLDTRHIADPSMRNVL